MENYTPEKIAAILNVKAATVRAWLRSHRLEGQLIGGYRWTITPEAFQKFKDQRTTAQSGYTTLLSNDSYKAGELYPALEKLYNIGMRITVYEKASGIKKRLIFVDNKAHLIDD
ncbi:MAG: helix-turn-helix domain-containing protein [Veillonellaceae bacterium]|nr:helix-turn-helix domain-containing protein [Veillonellaceae bacterium]